MLWRLAGALHVPTDGLSLTATCMHVIYLPPCALPPCAQFDRGVRNHVCQHFIEKREAMIAGCAVLAPRAPAITDHLASCKQTPGTSMRACTPLHVFDLQPRRRRVPLIAHS